MVCKGSVVKYDCGDRSLVRIFVGFVFLASTFSLTAQVLPEKDGLIHLGVASCASSVCHGKTTPQDATAVLQNEYTTWSQHDRHARAYKTLLSSESKRMARLLGIGAAHESALCLDCHGDNVNAGLRGRRFQISDGVGCEACHGGAEKWIKTHAEPGATHSNNIASGLYPTESPEQRARLCMSCHVGNASKWATHDMMGAGHPRLSFELDTFSVIQPMHYRIDKDYIERKGDLSGLKIWLAGQVFVAEHWLDSLRSSRFSGDALFPELSFYDCHACHHGMSDQREQSGLVTQPGKVRLNDAYLQLVEVIFESIGQQKGEMWRSKTEALLIAGTDSADKIKVISLELQAMLEGMAPVVKKGLSTAQQKDLLSGLLAFGKAPRALDYTTAEQVVMGVSVLLDSMGATNRFGQQLDAIYTALENEDKFQPVRFRQTLETFGKALGKVSL